MPFRTWCIAIALGLIAGSLQAQEQAGSRSERTGVQQDIAPAFGFPVRVIENEESAEATERREAEAHKWQYEDLIAQKSMEAAAHSAKRAAWLSFGAVAVGTALLIWNLALMRGANKAARDAVAVTREIGEIQSRSYLYVETIKFEDGPSDDQVSATVTVRNFGQSPAFKVSIQNVIAVVEIGAISREIPLPPREGTISISGLPPSQATTITAHCDIPNDSRPNLRDRSFAVFAYGAVTYTDGFKAPRLTRYQFVRDESAKGVGFLICGEGNYDA